MPTHIPFLRVLEAGDDRQLGLELRLARIRLQVAIVRALADEVEHCSRAEDAEGLGDQLIGEMTRLGCRLIEEASSLTASTRPADSGIFARTAAALNAVG